MISVYAMKQQVLKLHGTGIKIAILASRTGQYMCKDVQE